MNGYFIFLDENNHRSAPQSLPQTFMGDPMVPNQDDMIIKDGRLYKVSSVVYELDKRLVIVYAELQSE